MDSEPIEEESLLERDKIEIRRPIVAAPDDVWRCWAEPELIKCWWGEDVQLDLRVGGRFAEQWIDDRRQEVVSSGTVILCQPLRSFTLTWAEEAWRSVTEVTVMLQVEGPLRK